MKIRYTFLLLLTITICRAQHQTDNWYFGNGSGITFTTNPPSFLAGGQILSWEGCSSASDASGNLLFYSNGVTVWDRNHNPMPNGDSLFGGHSSTQSCLILEQPGTTLYYIITTSQIEMPVFKMSYSIVDMTLNGGNGDVTTKNTLLFNPSTEKLSAVKHSNGTDVWILGHEFGSNNFRSYLLTASGIGAIPVISSTGTAHSGDQGNAAGYLKASPCGDKIAAAVIIDNFVELFDFDNTTGIVSNPVLLGNWNGITSQGVYGMEFSPDQSRLYATLVEPGTIIQWNLLAGSPAAIIASATTINTLAIDYYGTLQNGPDGRMYVAKFYITSLACITNPNALGTACGYVDNYIPLSFTSPAIGLPNFLTSYFCNLSVNTNNPTNANCITSLYLNPAGTSITINLSANTTGNTQLTIVNILGANVYTATIPASTSENTIKIPLINFSKGIYFLTVQNKNGIQTKKVMVD